MLVILEGPDGAGKSTLARKLAARITTLTHESVLVNHFKKPERHPLNEYLRFVTGYRPGTGDHMIIDRFHLGEWVYPRLRDRQTLMNGAVFGAIESYLVRLGAVVVMCQQYADEYPRVYRQRGDADADRQVLELPRVHNLYLQVIQRTKLPVTHYNWQSAVNGHLNDIANVARVCEEQAALLNPFVTYSGPLRPAFLLLGDVRHGLDPASDVPNADPAFVPMPATSGAYLWAALGRGDGAYGVANACDRDDPRELVTALHGPRVVALGRNAHRRLEKLNVPHGVVPHPQFARRFHHKKIGLYGEAIAEAAYTGLDLSSWPNLSKVGPGATSTPRFLASSSATVAVSPAVTATSAT